MNLAGQGFDYNGSMTSSNSISTIWTTSNHSHNTTTGSLGNCTNATYSLKVDIKRCRNCDHAHLAEQPGCVDTNGYDVVFQPICSCKEYLPKDNLEYLEYLDKKKTDK